MLASRLTSLVANPDASSERMPCSIDSRLVLGKPAMNEATDFSDLDLLYQPNVPLGLELMSLWDELETTFGCKVDLGDVRYVKPSLKASITKDLIEVF